MKLREFEGKMLKQQFTVKVVDKGKLRENSQTVNLNLSAGEL